MGVLREITATIPGFLWLLLLILLMPAFMEAMRRLRLMGGERARARVLRFGRRPGNNAYNYVEVEYYLPGHSGFARGRILSPRWFKIEEDGTTEVFIDPASPSECLPAQQARVPGFVAGVARSLAWPAVLLLVFLVSVGAVRFSILADDVKYLTGLFGLFLVFLFVAPLVYGVVRLVAVLVRRARLRRPTEVTAARVLRYHAHPAFDRLRLAYTVDGKSYERTVRVARTSKASMNTGRPPVSRTYFVPPVPNPYELSMGQEIPVRYVQADPACCWPAEAPEPRMETTAKVLLILFLVLDLVVALSLYALLGL